MKAVESLRCFVGENMSRTAKNLPLLQCNSSTSTGIPDDSCYSVCQSMRLSNRTNPGQTIALGQTQLYTIMLYPSTAELICFLSKLTRPLFPSRPSFCFYTVALTDVCRFGCAGEDLCNSMSERSTGIFLVNPPICSCFWDINAVYWTAVYRTPPQTIFSYFVYVHYSQFCAAKHATRPHPSFPLSLLLMNAGFPTPAAAAAGPIHESRHRIAFQRHGAPRRDNGQAIGGEVALPFCCPMCRNGIKVGAGLQRFAGWS